MVLMTNAQEEEQGKVMAMSDYIPQAFLRLTPKDDAEPTIVQIAAHFNEVEDQMAQKIQLLYVRKTFPETFLWETFEMKEVADHANEEVLAGGVDQVTEVKEGETDEGQTETDVVKIDQSQEGEKQDEEEEIGFVRLECG